MVNDPPQSKQAAKARRFRLIFYLSALAFGVWLVIVGVSSVVGGLNDGTVRDPFTGEPASNEVQVTEGTPEAP